MYKRILLLLLSLTLSSCGFLHVRKPIIEQGNIIDSKNTAKLHTGMSAQEVVDVMGSPVLANIFTPNRMEYIYTYQNGADPRKTTKVSCSFERGRLKSVQES